MRWLTIWPEGGETPQHQHGGRDAQQAAAKTIHGLGQGGSAFVGSLKRVQVGCFGVFGLLDQIQDPFPNTLLHVQGGNLVFDLPDLVLCLLGVLAPIGLSCLIGLIWEKVWMSPGLIGPAMRPALDL